VGVFLSWQETHKAVDGFPGACYKGFFDENEAWIFAYPPAPTPLPSPPCPHCQLLERRLLILEQKIDFLMRDINNK
jgi:hypothetical protein